MNEAIFNPLSDILDAITEIQESLQGLGFHDYRSNRKIKIQTVTSLGHIIEAAESIPNHLKKEYPEFPWDYIHKFISLIVGDNMGIDEDTIWKIVKIELKHLEKLIKDVFKIS